MEESMNKKLVRVVLSCILIIVFATQACISSSNVSQQAETELSGFPVYKKAKNIPISASDAQRLAEDKFGYDLTLYQNTMDIRLSADEYAEIYASLEEQLIDKGWRDESALGIEAWKKDTHLLLLVFESMSSSKTDAFRRSYGIKDIEEGQILIITYVIDTDQLLPNPTETAKAEAYNLRNTEVAMNATNEAYQYMQQRTSEAIEKAQQSTQVAITATQSAYNGTQQAITQATQTALEEQKQQEAIQATSMALKPILDQMSTEFDESASLPVNMKVEREDPTRWDLTSKPGWLHISGRYQNFNDDNFVPKNVFVYPLSHTNISIITRVDGNMYRQGQSASLGLTPKSYEGNGYTVKLGVSMAGDSGREVYAWACFRDTCRYSYKLEFSDQIRFPGPVYLRLDMAGLTYTFYYSENGLDWIYLGKSEGYAAGDKLFLNVGGGDHMYTDDEFDAYFDFLRFEPLITN